MNITFPRVVTILYVTVLLLPEIAMDLQSYIASFPQGLLQRLQAMDDISRGKDTRYERRKGACQPQFLTTCRGDGQSAREK